MPLHLDLEEVMINLGNSSNSNRLPILEPTTVTPQSRYMLLLAAKAASRLEDIKKLLKKTFMLIGRCNINKIKLTMCSGSRI